MALELTNKNVPTNVQLYEPSKYPKSYTGISSRYRNELMDNIIPQIVSAVQGYEGNVDNYVAEAAGLAQNTGQNLLQDVLQTNMNSLVQRGMVNSKVAGTTLGAATGDVLKNVQNQAYQTGMQGAQMKLNQTDMLGQLAELGQYTSTTDASVPQRIIASLFAGTM